jgi:succinate dehydrogenase / fumarate reductase cytochrome b subunit
MLLLRINQNAENCNRIMAVTTSKISAVVNSSIGKKVMMALTGLFLAFFLANHLYTNLLLYKPLFDPSEGGMAFNEASHSMVTSIIIRTVEIVLFASIIFHVVQAIRLTAENKKARPVGYAAGSKAKTSWVSKNMGLTGSVILFFLIVHLYNFFLPYRVQGTVGGIEPVGDKITLAKSVALALQNPWYAGIYLISVVLIGMHLSHGIRSGFQSIGLNNTKYDPLLEKIAVGYSALITVGFASFPVMFYFNIMGVADLIK